MKHNLQSFPKEQFDLTLNPNYKPIEDWLHGFEQELRELRTFFDGNFKYLEIVRKAHVEMIDNILGEEGEPIT